MNKIVYQIMSAIVAFALIFGNYSSAGASSESAPQMAVTTYYVATTGNDANAGTSAAPFKTFSKAVSVLAAGDTLQVMAGTYNEMFTLSISGTASAPITVIGNGAILNMRGLQQNGITINGSYIKVSRFEVTGATDFGILVTGKYVIVENNIVHDNVTRNGIGTCDLSASWASAIKIQIGGDNSTVRGNTVYNNCGEGIAITRGKTATVENNTAYDNFVANIYVDNSPFVVVQNNLSYCTGTHLHNGNRASGIALGEESYSGWGAQLHDILILGNTITDCRTGIAAFASNVGGTFTNATITNNNMQSGQIRSISLQTTSNLNVLTSYNTIFNSIYVAQPAGVTLTGNVIGSIMPTSTSMVTLSSTPTVMPSSTSTVFVPSFIPTSTPAATNISTCLGSSGLLTTLKGNLTGYTNKSLAAFTKIDAVLANFTNGGQTPVNIGGQDICWQGGFIEGGYPLDASWNTTHPTAGISIYDGSPRALIAGVHITRIGDGIKIRQGETSGQAGISDPTSIRGVWLEDMRDDCVESDWQAGVNIDDSLFDGCYAVFAAQRRSSATTNGSNNTWVINNTLAYLRDQIGVYNGTSPGHSQFFKWDDTAPKIKIYNSIFRVDSAVSETSNQFNFRPDKLVDCANNTLVWLGPGEFPAAVPSCFKVTKDKSVWDNAVATWKSNHGYAPGGVTPTIAPPSATATKTNTPTSTPANISTNTVSPVASATPSIVPTITSVVASPVPASPTPTVSPLPASPTTMPVQPSITPTASSVAALPTSTFAQPSATPRPATPTASAVPVLPTSTPVQPTATAQQQSQPATETKYDDKNSNFVYSADWRDVALSQAYGGSFKKTNEDGSYVTFTFTGRSFSLLYTAASAYGKVNVYIDGHLVKTLNQGATTASYQKRWDYPTQLTLGKHTLKLVVETPNASIDAVIVR